MKNPKKVILQIAKEYTAKYNLMSAPLTERRLGTLFSVFEAEYAKRNGEQYSQFVYRKHTASPWSDEINQQISRLKSEECLFEADKGLRVTVKGYSVAEEANHETKLVEEVVDSFGGSSIEDLQQKLRDSTDFSEAEKYRPLTFTT